MSKKLIYRIQPTQDDAYPYNVQEIQVIQGQEVYSGFGRFCRTMEEANNYISSREGQKLSKDLADRIEFMFTNLEGTTNRHYFLTGMGSALALFWQAGVITHEQYIKLDDQIEKADKENRENNY